MSTSSPVEKRYIGLQLKVASADASGPGEIFTILRLVAKGRPGRFFFDMTNQPVPKDADLTQIVATHSAKIVNVHIYPANKEKDSQEEFSAHQFVYLVGKRVDEQGVESNVLCDNVFYCAVDFLLMRILDMEHTLILYKKKTGTDLFYFITAMDGRVKQALVDRDAQKKRFTEVVLEIARQLCEKTSLMHAHGIFHGDIKPENIFVEYDTSSAEIPAKVKVYYIDLETLCVHQPLFPLTVSVPRFMNCKTDPDRKYYYYGGTEGYADPRAPNLFSDNNAMGMVKATDRDAFTTFIRFETFSVGETIAAISIRASIYTVDFFRMMRKIFENMSGSFPLRVPLTCYATDFERLRRRVASYSVAPVTAVATPPAVSSTN